MRVLIGYDGSQSADAAIDDMQRAGMPRVSEVLVVSVADLLVRAPSVAEAAVYGFPSQRVGTAMTKAQKHNDLVMEEASAYAFRARTRIESLFPDWRVRDEVAIGAAGWELIDAANRWEADLVVVGSLGRSGFARFFLGSVSKKVVTDSSCSVRVSRGGTNKNQTDPVRIIIGVDGSPDSENAIKSVGSRVWPSGTEVRLVAVNDGTSTATIAPLLPRATNMIREAQQQKAVQTHSMIEWAAAQLEVIGLKTSISVLKGDPKQILISEAADWNADSIFVGTRGFGSSFERFRLGSISTAVVTGAECSVEVVRSPR